MTQTPFWKDWLLLASERVARQLYWSSPRLRSWIKRRRKRSLQAPRSVDRGALRQRLREIGVCEGNLVMAHTSTSGVTFRSGNGGTTEEAANPVRIAAMLVDELLGLVGPTGTLVMPTNPIYQNAGDFFLDDETKPPLKYDPTRTPCGVGLANELFWRRPGVLRSLHPYNSLAACGPLAEELLHDNLNESKPLPHGIHSGYYRFCQRNGLVVSVGTRLGASLTLVHAAEDALDAEYPIRDFFRERRYVVRADGAERTWTVREVRPEYPMFCRCGRKLWRDMLGAGILHEGSLDGVPIDWAHSREVFDYVTARCKRRPYPHYCTWLLRKKRR